MEKKQLFDSSLVGFYPEIFDSYSEISVDIGDNNYESNFTIDQTIIVDDHFINNYNKTPNYTVGVLVIGMTYNGDQTVRHFMSFVKGKEEYFANYIGDGFIYNITINEVNEVDKTIRLRLISKSISSDNTIVRLTTRVNGLSDLTIGGFNETVTLTSTEYNELTKISVGEIFALIDTNGNILYFTVKVSNSEFRSIRNVSRSHINFTNVISFIIALQENNQAKFVGRIEQLIDPNNYLAKDNTTEYTPTNDYNPATKKYVDDNINNIFTIYEEGEFDLDYTLGNNGFSSHIDYRVFLNKTTNAYSYGIVINDTEETTLHSSIVYSNYNSGSSGFTASCSANFSYYDINSKGFKVLIHMIIKGTVQAKFTDRTIQYNIESIETTCEQCILTESQYADLGNTSNDGVLYFITPD